MTTAPTATATKTRKRGGAQQKLWAFASLIVLLIFFFGSLAKLHANL
ncbi:hypothetical protein [Pseudorhodobacter sp.]|nr:hypothetical protein [Pseudorhodobacter sp.]